MTCDYCARRSPIYADRPCCAARLELDLARHRLDMRAVEIKRLAARIVGMASLDDRRGAIIRYGRRAGEEARRQLESEVAALWNGERNG